MWASYDDSNMFKGRKRRVQGKKKKTNKMKRCPLTHKRDKEQIPLRKVRNCM